MMKRLFAPVIFRLAALLSLLCVGLPASAMEIEHAEAKYQEREFRVELSLVLDVPAERVQRVLRDYGAYPLLDSSILEAKVLERIDANTLLLYTKLRACSGLFCRTVNRVERVQEAPFELIAAVVPEKSDVLAGHTHTVLQSLGQRTRVRYQTGVAPNFWVPGFIGRPLMLRTLREASVDLFRHIETRAKQ